MTTAIATLPGAGVLATGSERTFGIGRGGLRAAWQRYCAFRAAIAALGALSDRQLADIGIARGSIRRHAAAATYGK